MATTAISDQPGPSLRGTIEGQAHDYSDLEQKFAALAQAWKRRNRGRSVIKFHDFTYSQIIGLGWPVIPLLLKEVANGSTLWYYALKAITAESADSPQMQDNPNAIRDAWLDGVS